MAGDWIKMRSNLWDDPRVTKICDLTDQSEAAVIGGLYWLWAAADQHSEDGIMPGLTLRQIDRKTGVSGLGGALASIGWLADHPDGVRIVRFEEHNGSSAKKRCQTAKRVSNFKAGNASSVTSSLPSDSTGVSTALPREDIEKNKRTPHTPQGGHSTDDESPGQPEETGVGKPPRRTARSMQTFLAECKASGEKPIPEGDPVFAYADKTGIPLEFLRLHWLEFKARYCQPDAKRYKDWRVVYRKSVRGNWLRLWFIDSGGGVVLTTAGEQARRAHLEAA